MYTITKTQYAEHDVCYDQYVLADTDAGTTLTLNMEINAPGVHKGRGLMALAEHLGLRADQVMACGDSGNDLEMIRAAGLGVAMANATAPVLEIANYVTLSNEEDGVAAAVERFVL